MSRWEGRKVAGRKKLVNLDAMIPRADFALLEKPDIPQSTHVESISVRDFQSESLLLPNLRKPDFQRETNHWTPAQVASLIECFVNGDLIPSVILWSSPAFVFVIDGGHRLSALRAWVEDDYGDRHVSQQFFAYQITEEQKKAAADTRKLIESSVGSWANWREKNKLPDLPEAERKVAKNLSTRSIPVQWVHGNADKAEASFFKINTQGTPLDDIEQLLISNRRRPGAISARSIIRAGSGHKYWSGFTPDKQKTIEEKSKALYQTLFEPEINTPIKTLDLPLGGAAGVRTALAFLADFILVANRNQQGEPAGIKDQPEDPDGDATITVLDRTLTLAKRITGNDGGSLGLHPAVYFYGPSGRHTTALFMGVATLIARKLADNDSGFFKKFTACRAKLEDFLLANKQLVAAIIQQTRSGKRPQTIADLLNFLVKELNAGNTPTEAQIIDHAGVTGKVIVGEEKATGQKFSDDTKSAIYLKEALANALRCPECKGYLDPNKSVSYDHKTAVKHGGTGAQDNCQMTHPYCNQSVKQ
jgi:Protein of unknown function DUF262/HNH endonuclease